jgi:transcription elongation GreA/GreB family factor
MKQKIIQHYSNFLQNKIDSLRQMIADLTEDAKNDAKGSAGDKHETALSMMHLEQEKLNQKLKEFLETKSIFDSIDFEKSHTKVMVGSLVLANDIYFLISVSLPKVELEGKTIFAVSPQAPLAQMLLGSVLDDEFSVSNVSYKIQSIS